jgi:hypothetical protein
VRWWLAIALVTACGDNLAAPPCSDGDSRPCYAGVPASTEGVGICAPGIESCSAGTWTGICVGDITPRVEHCDGIDDDCNGTVDDVEEAGEACTLGGCTGVRACAGASVVCVAPVQNECDLCDGPPVTDLGDDCTANGCLGEMVCSGDLRSSMCDAPAPNACGLCGGPAVTGLGDPCMSADNCTGSFVCNVDNTAAECDAPLLNACDVCGPPVVGVGAQCSGDRGCVGVNACNGAGDGVVCQPASPCVHVVISELTSGSSVCNTDEFIELYNPGSVAVSLAGYTLRARPATGGTFGRLVTFATTAMIAPRGFFLVVSTRSDNPGCPTGYTSVPGNTVVGDATYSARDLGATGGQIWLMKVDADPTGISDVNVVDMVGYGNAAVFEGTAPTIVPVDATRPDGSIERKAIVTSTSVSMAAGGSDATAGNGFDADQNVTDFVPQAVRVPQNTASTAEP